VEQLNLPDGASVLDVATGTGLVARDVARRYRARVVGVDITYSMLRRARPTGAALVAGRAEQLPFLDASFDAVVFTYLLRYVADPAATLAEMARVLRPGGTMVSVEFGVPPHPVARAGWELYARRLLPLLAGRISRGWGEVGRFLAPSITEFHDRFPPGLLVDLWNRAGINDVRARRLTFGAGVVTWGVRESR
jgi:demethylmenaquinone methyltransferase/2-methoxy-6-polyprenyl-1,4-benzoquinol methylase